MIRPVRRTVVPESTFEESDDLACGVSTDRHPHTPMPELPEVESALRALRERVVGRTIGKVRLLHPSLRRRLSPSRLRTLRVAVVERVERRGKHQLLHLHDGRGLHAHFRMSGDWVFDAANDLPPRPAPAIIAVADGSRLAFLDSRALGTVDVNPVAAE